MRINVNAINARFMLASEFSAAELKAFLARRGRSQAGLAQHLGIDQSAVNRMVNGKRAIKAHEVPQIREYLDRTSDISARHANAHNRDQYGIIEPIERFPSLSKYIKGLVYPDTEGLDSLIFSGGDDYFLAMMLGRMLEDALFKLVLDKIDELETEFLSTFMTYRSSRALPLHCLDVAINDGFLDSVVARKVEAAFAVRDSFILSKERLSFDNDALKEFVAAEFPYPEESNLASSARAWFAVEVANLTRGIADRSVSTTAERLQALLEPKS